MINRMHALSRNVEKAYRKRERKRLRQEAQREVRKQYKDYDPECGPDVELGLESKYGD